MNKLILFDNDISDVKFHIDRFPDGEVSIVLDSELDRKHPLLVITRITSAEDLFILLQLGDILDRHCMEWNLYIPYLMSMRMDRVMSFNRPFSLNIVCSLISNMKYQNVYVLEGHNPSVLKRLLRNYNDARFNYESIIDLLDRDLDSALVFPDEGCMKRLSERLSDTTINDYVVFEKVRDLDSGRIVSFTPHIGNLKHLPNRFIFVDDLCDGGGTFLGELEVLKEKYPSAEYDLVITHAVNENGLRNVSKQFNKVYLSNSYKDWGYIQLECKNVFPYHILDVDTYLLD